MAESIKGFLKVWWGYMSCAVWTIIGFCVLFFNPTTTQQKWIYIAVTEVLLAVAFLQIIYRQRREIGKLTAQPPEIDLRIHDVVMHRTGDEDGRWRNGDFLVQVSAELLNLLAAEVEYSAQLVFRGEVLQLNAIQDIDDWEIIEREYYKQLSPSMSRPRSSFVTNPFPVSGHLSRSMRNEGWLHFQIEGMVETEIAKRTLRLYATAKCGGSHVDRELAQDHVVCSKLVATKKYSASSSA